MGVEQAQKLKEMENENGRLKKLVVDLTLDNAILKEAMLKGENEIHHAVYTASTWKKFPRRFCCVNL
jgi:predicted secreted acid phosphatase